MDSTISCVLNCYGVAVPMSAYATVVLAVQGVARLLKWAFSKNPILRERYRGVFRLGMIYLLTMLVALVLLPFCKLNLFQAFIHANVLAYAQVFGHQIYKGIKRYKQ